MSEERSEGVTGADMAEAFLRTVTHDLTSEGTPAPPDWSSMFAVLIQGPAFVPADFESNVPGQSVNERAWAYVEPYVKAYRRLNFGSRRLFITERGRLGTSSQYVFLQSLALLLLPPLVLFPFSKLSCPDYIKSLTVSGTEIVDRIFT